MGKVPQVGKGWKVFLFMRVQDIKEKGAFIWVKAAAFYFWSVSNYTWA